jgi:hypothetical protein
MMRPDDAIRAFAALPGDFVGRAIIQVTLQQPPEECAPLRLQQLLDVTMLKMLGRLRAQRCHHIRERLEGARALFPCVDCWVCLRQKGASVVQRMIGLYPYVLWRRLLRTPQGIATC